MVSWSTRRLLFGWCSRGAGAVLVGSVVADTPDAACWEPNTKEEALPGGLIQLLGKLVPLTGATVGVGRNGEPKVKVDGCVGWLVVVCCGSSLVQLISLALEGGGRLGLPLALTALGRRERLNSSSSRRR